MSCYFNEFQLVHDFCGHLESQLAYSAHYWRLCREVSVGGTIADVAIVQSKQPWAENFPVLSVKRAVVLAHLRKFGSTRIDLLEKSCGYKPGELRDNEIQELSAIGLVRMGRGGKVSLAAKFKVKIVAIEAKLVKWRAALQQASSYLSYADEAFVVLPEKSAANAIRNKSEFLECGIGLYVLGESSIEPRIRPRRTSGHGWRREFVLSRLLNATLSSDPKCDAFRSSATDSGAIAVSHFS